MVILISHKAAYTNKYITQETKNCKDATEIIFHISDYSQLLNKIRLLWIVFRCHPANHSLSKDLMIQKTN